MKESNCINQHDALFIQHNIYQHLHNAALQAALKGMDDVVTSKVVMQKSLKLLSGKLSVKLSTKNAGKSIKKGIGQ